MNFMFKFSGYLPLLDVTIYTYSETICYSYFSSFEMKSLFNSSITVTKSPETV